VNTLFNTPNSYLWINFLDFAVIVIADPEEEGGFRSVPGVGGGPFLKDEYLPLIVCGILVTANDDCRDLYILSRESKAPLGTPSVYAKNSE
jgi:hypothetical protein